MSVVWTDKALDQLAVIYVRTPPGDRDALVRHVERITARLEDDPGSVGESRGPNRRAWFTGPFAVVYDLPLGGGVVVRNVARLRGAISDPDAE